MLAKFEGLVVRVREPFESLSFGLDKYGEHSISLAAGRDNYLFVVDNALDAAIALESQPEPESDQ